MPSQKDSTEAGLLTSDLDFDALSYAWGNSVDAYPVELKGKVIRLGRNLSIALLRLRSYYGDTRRWIWIDAVCIYSHRSAMKDLGIMRFTIQSCEGFNFK